MPQGPVVRSLTVPVVCQPPALDRPEQARRRSRYLPFRTDELIAGVLLLPPPPQMMLAMGVVGLRATAMPERNVWLHSK